MLIQDVDRIVKEMFPRCQEHVWIKTFVSEGIQNGIWVRGWEKAPPIEGVVVELPRTLDFLQKHAPEIKKGSHVIFSRCSARRPAGRATTTAATP